jgi:hypothetical protein
MTLLAQKNPDFFEHFSDRSVYLWVVSIVQQNDYCL